MKFETKEQFAAWYERSPAGRRTSAAVDKASEQDRIWFEKHPGATTYTRRALKDEFPPTRQTVTLVRVDQIAPGYRVRQALAVTTAAAVMQGGYYR